MPLSNVIRQHVSNIVLFFIRLCKFDHAGEVMGFTMILNLAENMIWYFTLLMQNHEILQGEKCPYLHPELS